MEIPPWADFDFSEALPVLRERGEGQALEFKREFPSQAHELAKEIAAFATSNEGIILLGVEDNGAIVGLEGMKNPVNRDKLLRRLEGVCNKSVKPAVTPKIFWALEYDMVVLGITIPKGRQPIYYCNNIPYLRHMTSSRPAEPHEVIDIFRNYFNSEFGTNIPADDDHTQFYTHLATAIITILSWAEVPLRYRLLNPWLDEWKAECSQVADELRSLAAQQDAIELELDIRMQELANALDEVIAFPLYMGCQDEVETLATKCMDLALDLKRATIDTIELGDDSLRKIPKYISGLARQLQNMADQADDYINNRGCDEFKCKIAGIGNDLLRISFYDLSYLGDGAAMKLRKIALNIRLIEMIQTYLDGGKSERKLIEAAQKTAQELVAFSANIEQT